MSVGRSFVNRLNIACLCSERSEISFYLFMLPQGLWLPLLCYIVISYLFNIIFGVFSSQVRPSNLKSRIRNVNLFIFCTVMDE